MTNNGVFWYPAKEPCSQVLNNIVYTVLARNIFCTHHVTAEGVRRGDGLKRPRSCEQGSHRARWLGASKGGTRSRSALTDAVDLLLRSFGPECDARKEEHTTLGTAKLTTVQIERHCTLGTLSSAPETGEEGKVSSTQSLTSPSILTALIEAALAKERFQATERNGELSGTCDSDRRHSLPDRSVAGGERGRGSRASTLEKDDGDEEFGVPLLEVRRANPSECDESLRNGGAFKHPLQMTREEFLAQYKRAPRRGEIGYSADSVAAAEALGYVMSGSRNREKQHYVDGIQQKLHEKEARKLRLQFRKVEDERNDSATVETLLTIMRQKVLYDTNEP